MTERKKFTTVDEYMAAFDGETKQRLDQLRGLILQFIPDVTERISYNIPAYFMGKKLVVYFSGYEHHVSLYPGRAGSKEHKALAAEYGSGKSTLKFPHTKPLPLQLIKEFIELRMNED